MVDQTGIWYYGSQNMFKYFRLPDHNTAFQTEITANKECIGCMKDIDNKNYGK